MCNLWDAKITNFMFAWGHSAISFLCIDFILKDSGALKMKLYFMYYVFNTFESLYFNFLTHLQKTPNIFFCVGVSNKY